MLRTQLKDHALLGRVAEHYRHFLREALVLRPKPVRYTRLPKPDEEYAGRVLESIGAVLAACDQLHFSIDLLSGYRKAIAPKEMSRYNYLVFGVENFLVRYVTVSDRCLRLANDVYDLGLPAKECRASTIIQNGHIRGTVVATSLKAIDKATEPYREDRNRVAHSATYHEKSLGPIGSYFRVEALGDKELSRFAAFVKALSDKFVRDKKLEFKRATVAIEGDVGALFDAFLPRVTSRLGTNA